jgi:hypothetical protein
MLLLLLHRIIVITATKVLVVVLVVVLVLQLLIRIPRVAFSRKRIHSFVLLISLLKRHVLLLCLLSSSYACIRRIPTTIDITATMHRHHRWRSSDTPDGLSRHIFPVRIGAVHPRFERLVVVKFRVVPQFRFGHFLPRFVLFELKMLFEKKRESGQTRPDVKRTTTISRCFARRENASTRGEKSGFRIKTFTNETTKKSLKRRQKRYKERTPALPPPNEVSRPKNPPPDPPLLAFSAILV